MSHIPFPSIEQFRTVLSNLKKIQNLPDILTLEGTVKLHGTNASLVINDTNIVCQSRNRILSDEKDNCGFSQYINSIPKDKLITMIQIIRDTYANSIENLVIYGEWCGSTIQSHVALAQLPKMFVIFAIKINNVWQETKLFHNIMLPDYHIFNISRVPNYTIFLDINNPNNTTMKLKSITDSIEKECPWAKSFGVNGIGEGCVWKFTEPELNNSKFWFKVKGDKHTTSKVTTLKELSPNELENLKNVQIFVEKAVTNNRLEQGLDYLREINVAPILKNISVYLKWLINDTFKEEADYIRELKLDKCILSKQISKIGKEYFNSQKNEF